MQTKMTKWMAGAGFLALITQLQLGSVASASTPCKPGAVLDAVVEQYGEDLAIRLSRVLEQGPDAVGLSAKELRKAPGVASVSRPLPSNPDRMMRGTEGNAGLVPKEVADRLSGREYADFDGFRSDVWKTIGDSRYAQEFSPSNRALMSRGNAPRVTQSQRAPELGKSGEVYNLHHITPIVQGGSVYEVSNLMIVTPRFHKEVLGRTYHYGK